MVNQYPKWVLKHKPKGTQVTKIRDSYYLYKVRSKWDNKKNRAQKVTEKYLGKITQDGLIPPKIQQMEAKYSNISVKEYGASWLLQSMSKDILKQLKITFPYDWKEIFVLALLRMIEKSPLKNVQFYYHNSFISETLKNTRTSDKFLGHFLREIGMQRELIKDFMRSFMVDTKYGIVDLTHVFSYSENVMNAMLGHNKDDAYIPQINLLLIYSLDKTSPVYFRQLPGSISDVSSVIKTVNETLVDKFIFIGDKGLHSEKNIDEFKEEDIDYVLALRRDSSHINYDNIISGDRRRLDGHFLFQSRGIWFYSSEINETEKVITYIDHSLKTQEETDYIKRIKQLEREEELDEEQKKAKECYRKRLYEQSHRNGTLSVRTNLAEPPEKVYQIMKSRVHVEQAFDTFKNTLNADRTHMRDDKQVEGWLFINFIAMQLYYKIYALLLSKDLLNKHSPLDVINYLKRVTKIRIGDKWQVAEISKKSRDLIKKIGAEIPIT